MTKPLSPAAEAVMDAAFPAYEDEHLYTATCEQHVGMIAAAALRAAADQLTPYRVADFDGAGMARNKLLAIAAELEVVK